jgi:hypothetical protein
MLAPETWISQHQIVTDLAQHRRRRGLSRTDRWRADREFLISFAEYFQGRIEKAEIGPGELIRLGIAFDLRRIRLMSCLTSLLSEEYLVDQASCALRSAERLADEIAAPVPETPLVSSIASELVLALDAVIATLDSMLNPPYRIHQ